jgi:hypothetical protein
MGFTLKTIAALLLFLIVGRTAAYAQTDGPDTTAITIFVYNDARVPPTELTTAEQGASFIFRRSGVAVEWLNCVDAHEINEDCHLMLHPSEFTIRIVPKGRTSKDTVFGMAFLAEDGSGKQSDIFFDRIDKAHRANGTSAAGLLGAVTAHELGHLLLGSHAHSRLGIMSPYWGKEDLRRISMGSLRFTPDQCSLLRARISDWQAHWPTAQVARGCTARTESRGMGASANPH